MDIRSNDSSLPKPTSLPPQAGVEQSGDAKKLNDAANRRGEDAGKAQRLPQSTGRGSNPRRNAEGDAVRPGGDRIELSPDAERLARIEANIQSFERPSKPARIAELQAKYRAGELNTGELIQRTAERMLEGEARGIERKS